MNEKVRIKTNKGWDITFKKDDRYFISKDNELYIYVPVWHGDWAGYNYENYGKIISIEDIEECE